MNAYNYRFTPSAYDKTQTKCLWEVTHANPFNELIISWNILRPRKGSYQLFISLKNEEWSPWYSYAEWGSHSQKSFHHQDTQFTVFQDTISVKQQATGWRVLIQTEDIKNLNDLEALYASMPQKQQSNQQNLIGKSICLNMPALSQLKIQDPRSKRICSPASVTAVLAFLLGTDPLNPLVVAEKIWDTNFDIFGNWTFATACAYALLGKGWESRVAFLSGFEEILQLLKAGFPVITSVKGCLPGSHLSYEEGHLLVVRGFDDKQSKVLCMDPAFPEDYQTFVAYPLDDYLACWHRRKNIAYIINRRCV